MFLGDKSETLEVFKTFARRAQREYNSKAYRVFNQTSGLVEETCDMEFDESNGSQEEVIDYDNVVDEEIEEGLKKTSIGDIKPEEVHESNDQGEDLPRQHQAPPWHPKWMKIKKRMIHNLKKVFQRQHPKSKNKKSKMFHHKHKSSVIHLNKHPRMYC